jgi:hypothetical protein
VTPIVVLDVESCIEHSESIGDEASVDYFETVKGKGYKYISLDGQNRSKHIERVINNSMTISGRLKDADGNFHDVENKFLKDMDQRLIDHITTICSIPVSIMKEETRYDASDLFQSLNDGVPLNDQEKRQSIGTPIADVVREIAEERKDISKRILREDQIIRMEDDETYAKILMTLFKQYRVDGELVAKVYDHSDDRINDFYMLGFGFSNINDPGCPYLLTEVSRAKEIIKLFSAVMIHQTKVPKSKSIPRKNWWAVLYVCEWIYDNNYRIQDYNQFYDCLKKLDDKLASDSESEYGAARKEKISQGLDPDTVSRSGYYSRWQSLPHIPAARVKRTKAILKEVKSNLTGLTIKLKSAKLHKAA